MIDTSKVFLLMFFLLTASACRPTYENTNVASDIKDICTKEYNTQVDVVVSGKTVYAVLELDALLMDMKFLSEDDLEKIGNALAGVSRVVLSSGGGYEFIVLAVKGTGVDAFGMKFIRFVEDIKRVQLMEISRGEFFERLIIETELVSDAVNEYPEIIFEEFLAKLSAKRLNTYFENESGVSSKAVSVTGYFHKDISEIPPKQNVDFIKDTISHDNLIDRIFIRTVPYYKKLKAKRFAAINRDYSGFFRFEIDVDLISDDVKKTAYNLCVQADSVAKKLFRRYGFKAFDQIHYDLTVQNIRFVSLR